MNVDEDQEEPDDPYPTDAEQDEGALDAEDRYIDTHILGGRP